MIELALALALAGAGPACRLEPLRTIDLLVPADAGADQAEPPKRCDQPLDGGIESVSTGDDDAGVLETVCNDRFEPPVPDACGSRAHDQKECPGTVGFGMSCWKSCGPAKTGTENCECGDKSCPPTLSTCLRCAPCSFDPSPSKNYSCYALPNPMRSCPYNGGANEGYILSGDPCPYAACQPCKTTYLDSNYVLKEGFCLCDHPSCRWSCATKEDWPSRWLTDR